MKKWIVGWALLGLLVSLTCELLWRIGGMGFGSWTVYIWPSSIFLLALDSPTSVPTSTVVFVWTLSVVANVVAYMVVGAVIWSVFRILRAAKAG
jgi:hypothetical protein